MMKGAKDSKNSTALVEFSLLCSLTGGIKGSLGQPEPWITTALIKGQEVIQVQTQWYAAWSKCCPQQNPALT